MSAEWAQVVATIVGFGFVLWQLRVARRSSHYEAVLGVTLELIDGITALRRCNQLAFRLVDEQMYPAGDAAQAIPELPLWVQAATMLDEAYARLDGLSERWSTITASSGLRVAVDAMKWHAWGLAAAVKHAAGHPTMIPAEHPAATREQFDEMLLAVDRGCTEVAEVANGHLRHVAPLGPLRRRRRLVVGWLRLRFPRSSRCISWIGRGMGSARRSVAGWIRPAGWEEFARTHGPDYRPPFVTEGQRRFLAGEDGSDD